MLLRHRWIVTAERMLHKQASIDAGLAQPLAEQTVTIEDGNKSAF